MALESGFGNDFLEIENKEKSNIEE